MRGCVRVLVVSSLGGAPPSLAFRGWRVVAGAFITSMVGFGAIYSYGAFSATLAATFHMSLAATSVIISLSNGLAFALSAFSGLLAERFGSQALAVTGMLVIACGLMLAASSTNASQIYLGYGVFVGIGTGLAYVPAFAAVQRWFITWRGLASGIAASGIGVGTLLVHPMNELLSQYGDWRTTFKISSFMVTLIGIAGAVLLSDSPEQWGDYPDNLPHHSGLISTSPVAISLRQALASTAFRRMYVGIMLVSVPVALPYAYLTSSAMSEGFSLRQAVGLISIIGVGSIAGRLIVASTADRLGRRPMFMACCVGLAVVMLVWANAYGFGFDGFAIAFGLFYGGFVALLPTFTVDHFGREHVASIMGLLYTGRAVAQLFGPPVVATFIMGTHGSMATSLEMVALIAGVGCYLLTQVRSIDAAEQTTLAQDVEQMLVKEDVDVGG